MNLAPYFSRIGYDGPRDATLETLRALALRQPQAIAFENLAVTAGGVPEISLDAITDKLLHQRRGGYCYEQNTLLQAVLGELGFRVTAHLARVRYQLPADYVMERGHMVLRVDLPEGRYIVDAGFGGLTLTAPMALRFDDAQATPHEDLRFVPAGEDYRLQARFGTDWADVYQFDLSPQLPADILPQNWFTATRPGALFRENLVVTRPVPGGRYALFNQTLTWRPLGAAAERRKIAGADALGEALREVFGLSIPADQVETAARVAARATADMNF